ncbi:MAG TPA: hypothetical protein VIL29_04645 [Pseudothermotoga sp.]|uniref:hypothetical protein n=1 Tax=Thermotoga profunda TaxID=1508420 RepID=UPI000596CA80|nr:hypothetical protein [Thermotoga profunda]
MITPIDLQTVIVKGTDISSSAAQSINAQIAASQLLKSEILSRAEQQMRMVNPENKIEEKIVKTATEEGGGGSGGYYFGRKRQRPEKEEKKGFMLDVRL